MNKSEYLFELEKALKAAHVKDSDDILEEYGQHFELKLADGYSEEEIAAKLAAPKEIAAQFQGIGGDTRGKSRAVLIPGLVFIDLFAGMFFLLLYAWVVVFGVFAICAAAVGVLVVFGQSAWGLIPEIPVFCAQLLGIAILALAVLSAVGTVYCYLYSTQLLKACCRWHRSVLGQNALPPLPKHPPIKAKKRRLMRNIALISVAVFAVCFVVGYVSMAIAAGALEFWHVWHWFE